jgi:DNA mismatch repair ATPase MutS
MFDWVNQHIEKATADMEEMISESTGIPKHGATEEKIESEPLYQPFQLPIQYLDESERHILSPVVSNDLELYQPNEEKSVYDIMFQPSSPFAKDVFQEWSKQYTTNTVFLEETQQVIEETPLDDYPLQHALLMEMWKDTKDNKEYFLEKYGYIDWNVLKSFNRSSTFLQVMAMSNMMSPAISLLLPFIFMIIPFIVLRIRGVPITFSDYITVLQEITKNHFIGKFLGCFTNMSAQNLMYVVMMGGLYFYQMYHNVISCIRFYNNIHKVNHYVCTLKEYIGSSVRLMDQYTNAHGGKTQHTQFCTATQFHSTVLREFGQMLEPVQPVEKFIYKLGSVGYLMKCYYELHAHPQYEESLRYSFGFEGYIDNLRGLKRHLQSNILRPVSFSQDKPTCFKNQYYPFHIQEDECVKNTCDLSKKIIITGPNASGKTTLLKTNTINVVMCQQFGVGFFERGSIRPYTHIHSYLNIPDTSERDSLFQAESRRCKEIIDSIQQYPAEKGYRHYCIFDELYSGTNPVEASKSAYAFLKYTAKFSHVDFILTTHYTSVCSKLKKSKQISNYKMNVKEKGGKMVYTYSLKKGISKVQGAVSILEDMNYPEEIVQSVKSSKHSQDDECNE